MACSFSVHTGRRDVLYCGAARHVASFSLQYGAAKVRSRWVRCGARASES